MTLHPAPVKRHMRFWQDERINKNAEWAVYLLLKRLNNESTAAYRREILLNMLMSLDLESETYDRVLRDLSRSAGDHTLEELIPLPSDEKEHGAIAMDMVMVTYDMGKIYSRQMAIEMSSWPPSRKSDGTPTPEPVTKPITSTIENWLQQQDCSEEKQGEPTAEPLQQVEDGRADLRPDRADEDLQDYRREEQSIAARVHARRRAVRQSKQSLSKHEIKSREITNRRRDTRPRDRVSKPAQSERGRRKTKGRPGG